MILFLQWPATGPVSSAFGSPRSYGGHVGVDIAVPTGTPVRAAAAGRVTASGRISDAAGYGVKIDHGGGVSTSYFHFSNPTAGVGQNVQAGEVVGYSGATGSATGPHLHFEVRRNGQAINPLVALQSGVEYDGAPPGGTSFLPAGGLQVDLQNVGVAPLLFGLALFVLILRR